MSISPSTGEAGVKLMFRWWTCTVSHEKEQEQTTRNGRLSVRYRILEMGQADIVATASYRLLPHITIRSPIPQEHQEKFRDCFPPGVIAIENDSNGNPQCIVKNPRKDTVSREVLRHPEFQDLVQLSRIRDHFLCTSIH